MKSYKKMIAILGEDLSVKGGITSVLRAYLNSPLRVEFDLRHIPTLIEGSAFAKLRIFGRALVRFTGWLVAGKIDLVHIHTSSFASFYRKSLLVLIAKFFRRPIILHIHGSRFHLFFENATPLVRKWISWTLDQVDQIIVLSQSWHARVAAMTRNSNILVLKNPVNPSEMLPVRHKLSPDFTVLFLGELSQRKGVFDLLAIANELCQEFPQLKWVLAGNGEVESIRQTVRDGQLQEQIQVPGWIDPPQRRKLLHAADLFVLPSYEEGLPVALLEAMANGLPVVSTFAGGIPELVTQHENGLLVPPGDQITLKQAIKKIILTPELREKFAQANRRKIENEYDIEIIARQVRSLYLRLAREKPKNR